MTLGPLFLSPLRGEKKYIVANGPFNDIVV